MQVKIIIGTVAFMMAMMVFGYSALREPARLDRFTLAREARQVEGGAHLFESNCLNCHGEEGKAEICTDPSSGEQIGCVGLPLNYAPLLCGDPSLRMEAMNWEGSKDAFLQSTITSGRPGTEMPTWAQSFGGPLRDDQIVNLSLFVLNWETEELCSAPIIVFDWPETYEAFSEEFPEGDPADGEQLFLTLGCAGCHGNMDDESSASVGPWLGDIATNAATRIDGMDAEQYVYESILAPSDFIAPDCPTGPCTGPPSLMPDNFPIRMGENPQQMQDLIAFLFSQ